MWGIDPYEILIDLLKFKGFRDASWLDRVKWITIYPIALAIFCYLLIRYYLYVCLDKLKSKR